MKMNFFGWFFYGLIFGIIALIFQVLGKLGVNLILANFSGIGLLFITIAEFFKFPINVLYNISNQNYFFSEFSFYYLKVFISWFIIGALIFFILDKLIKKKK